MTIVPFRSLILAAALMMSAIHGVPTAKAASVYDKVEQLGEMAFLRVDNIRFVRRDDFLNVQAELVNMSPYNQQLYYRYKWLDDAGFTVGGEETWKPVLIYGGQKKQLETIAPVPAATDFRLELQSPDNMGVGN
jgi:uncharacterized protein YcfL